GHTTLAWIQLPGEGAGSAFDVAALNADTGTNSENQAEAAAAQTTSVTNENTATVVNDVAVLADSGGNTAQGSSASIQTGDAA
ncbi:MAG: hypothetical protein COX49_01495, partial [bacterium (Candidatus Stahlbacteria) CG23_combo_of_CG06-09_8_20_14_all_40_9]